MAHHIAANFAAVEMPTQRVGISHTLRCCLYSITKYPNHTIFSQKKKKRVLNRCSYASQAEAVVSYIFLEKC